jgi:hypothetical protein
VNAKVQIVMTHDPPNGLTPAQQIAWLIMERDKTQRMSFDGERLTVKESE